ncbi:hypothetical protein BH09GEM1_BH09GEM1_48400 [soil metagenome]
MDIPRRITRFTRAAGLVLCVVLAASAHAQQAPAGTTTASVPPLHFTGEVRVRSELDVQDALASDLFTYLRTRIGLRVDPAPGAAVFLQLQDSRVLGTEGNSASATTDVFDLHQGYVQLSGESGGHLLALRAGRQEIALGNERLVGSVNWSNTGRSFDGVLATLAPQALGSAPAPWTLTAFGAVVDERGRRFGGATPVSGNADHSLLGAFLATAPAASTADATLLYDDGMRYRSYADAKRVSLDMHVKRRFAPVRVELEGAIQAGTQHALLADTTRFTPQDVRAWLVGARVGATVASRGDVTIGVDALSGDDTPADGTYTAFSTMYATNHAFYGLIDVIGDPAASTKDRGLVDVFMLGAWRVSDAFTPRAELHRFSLERSRAGLLASEVDLVAPFRLTSASAVELGYSLFRPGASAAAVGLGALGADRQWLYLQLRAGF